MIHNKTKNIVVSLTEIQAKTMWSQGWGLMFRRKQNLVMHFSSPRIVSLHNLFVFFALEIILLDEQKKIITIKKEFKPWTPFWAYKKKKARWCIELGLEKSKGLCKIGDILEFS